MNLQWRLPSKPLMARWRYPDNIQPALIISPDGRSVDNLIGPQGSTGPAGLQGPQGEAGPQGEQGPPGPAGILPASRQVAGIGGRWYLYADNRWTGFSVNYGAQTENYTQNNGTNAEPDIIWNQIGPLLLTGSRVKQLRVAGRCNSNEVTGIDIRLYHQSGPWTDRWDSNAETVRALLFSADNLDFSTSDMRMHIMDFDAPISSDGFLLLMVRPVGILSMTRYLTSSVSAAWETP